MHPPVADLECGAPGFVFFFNIDWLLIQLLAVINNKDRLT